MENEPTGNTSFFTNGLRNFEAEYPIATPLPEVVKTAFNLSADLIEQQQAEIKLFNSKKAHHLLEQDRLLAVQAAREANEKVREQQAEINRLREAMQQAMTQMDLGSNTYARAILETALKGAAANAEPESDH